MTKYAIRSMVFEPVGSQRRWWHRLRHVAVLGFAFCIAATSGAVAWDKMRPWLNPLDCALAASEAVPVNTEESKGMANRLLAAGNEIERALRAMEQRGDTSAGRARGNLHHRHTQRDLGDITVQQIRSRLEGMPRDEFIAWLERTLR